MFPAVQDRSITIPAARKDSLLLSHAFLPILIGDVKGVSDPQVAMWQGKVLEKLEDMDHYLHVVPYLFPEDGALFMDKLH